MTMNQGKVVAKIEAVELPNPNMTMPATNGLFGSTLPDARSNEMVDIRDSPSLYNG
jgi:hypothetical protein